MSMVSGPNGLKERGMRNKRWAKISSYIYTGSDIYYPRAKNNTHLLPTMFSGLGRACPQAKYYTHAVPIGPGIRVPRPVGKIAIPSCIPPFSELSKAKVHKFVSLVELITSCHEVRRACLNHTAGLNLWCKSGSLQRALHHYTTVQTLENLFLSLPKIGGCKSSNCNVKIKSLANCNLRG